jgi:hypothetical protein
MSFDSLNKMIEDGIEGKNQSIPIGMSRLGKYANIRKNILTLIFSSTGCGKSGMLDSIILNACNDYMLHPSEYKLKPDFQLFSMERSKIMRIAKWLSHIIFIQEGVEIQLPKMLGWWEEKLTKEEHNLIKKYEGYVEQLLNDFITIHDGAKTPNEIYRIMKDHLEDNGEYSEEIIKGKKHKIYTPTNSNIVVIPAFDHGNLTKTTKELPAKKQAIDKLVEYTQGFRDLEGCAPIWISQINRSISSITRIKDQEHELLLEDVKESGDIGDACDIAISLFDPVKYQQSSRTGYTPTDFIDTNTGANYFRSAQILKSSYGADNLRVALAFNGFCGQFKELPKKKDLSDDQYSELIESVINKSYFLS